MADQESRFLKVSELPTVATPAGEDLLMLTDDPGGTPIAGQATLSSVRQEVLLHDETLGAAGVFDVSSISQNYDDLILLAMIRTDVAATADYARIFYNNDTTVTNYHSQWHAVANGAGNSASETATSNVAYCAAATSTANSFTMLRVNIPLYTDTNYLKICTATSAMIYAAGAIYANHFYVIWEDGGTTAINRIQLRPDGYPTNEFVANSRLRIIGVKYGN